MTTDTLYAALCQLHAWRLENAKLMPAGKGHGSGVCQHRVDTWGLNVS